MTRLLNTLFIFVSMLLLSIPLYAKLPVDSLLDKYVKGLRTAIEQKVAANKTAVQKDYLVVYEDPNDPKFRTDFVNNGRDFWFTEGLNEESVVRNLVNDAQDKTGGEPLYVVLGSIYNYADLEDVNQTITWSAKNKYKPAEQEGKITDIRHRFLPALAKKKGLAGTPHSVLYVISYFTIGSEGYKVSHRCFFESAFSLKQSGFVVNATDKVETTNKTETDLRDKRVSYLKSTITAVIASMGQFSEELKRVNALFAQLAESSLGKKFYNDYNGVCKDQLVLKKLALLINDMGLNAYTAYLGDKNESDGYDAVVFRAFYNNLQKFYDSYKKVSQQLTEVKTGGELATVLKALTSSELGALTYPQRIQAIRLLNQLVTLSDDTWWAKLCEPVAPAKGADTTVVAGSEQLMIDLIASTPDSDVRYLKGDLKGTDGSYSLLLNIFKNTDDEGVGDNNYTKLIRELAVMLVRNTTAQELDDLYSKNRLYTWNNGSLRTIIDDETTPPVPFMFGDLSLSAPTYLYFSYTPKFPERYKVTLQKYGAIEGGAQGEYGQPVMRVCTTSCRVMIPLNEGNQQLDPFDMIAFIPEGNINFNTGLSIEANQVVMVPAFFLQWYTDKKNNAAIKSDIKLGVNLTLAAVSIASGAGGILTAATRGARLLIAAQTFFAVTALTSAQYPQFDTFLRNNLGNLGYSLFKGVEWGVNMYSGLQGAAVLGKGIYNAAQRLSKSLLDLLKNRPDLLAQMQRQFPDKFAKLAALFKAYNGTALEGIVAAEGGYAAFLEKVAMTYGQPANGIRPANFSDISNAFVESGASFLQTPGLPGGVGGTTALVMDAQKVSSAVKYSKGLLEQLKANYPSVIDEGIATLVEVETQANTMAQLTAAQAANNVAKVQVLTNASQASKIVIAQGAVSSYVLYAWGAAKTEVEDYVKKLQQCDLCPEESLICLLEKRATYQNKTAALAKLCGQLPAGQLKPICMKLNTYGVSLLNTFLGDVIDDKPVPNCNGNYTFLAKSIPSLTPGIVAAWENYVDADRTCLRVSMYHLRKMDAAWNNPRVRMAPFSFTWDDFMLIAMAARQNTENSNLRYFAGKYDSTVFDNIQSFCRLQATFINMDKLKAKLQQQNSGPSLAGVNFTIKYMGEHTSMFNGQTLKFEDPEESDGRDVDVLGVGPTEDENMYYEFKSVKKFELKYAKQFVKDLRNAARLDQIKWIFDKRMTRAGLLEEVVNQMTKQEIRILMTNELTLAKKQKYIPGYTPIMGTLTATQVEAFIKLNFDSIFIIEK